MGIFNPPDPPKPQGPSQAELDAQRRAEEQRLELENKKKEEQAQLARNRRGRRSLLAESNTGSGYDTLGG
tara:strand:- start:1234 stop:1443 length:210 start_codon:yes stop_codon:yes gene_type:complete